MKLLNIILLAFLTSLNACAQNTGTDKVETKSKEMQVVNTFVNTYSDYKMNIQAAGIATIPTASFENDILIIEYAYFSEGENRKGKTTLTFNKKTDRFEGNWQTDADNGNVYKGSLYFVFDENGEAKGEYQFANSDYKITIFRVSK